METSHSVSAIGLMSGTSLDGLDIACVQFMFHSGKLDYKFISTTTAPYPEVLKDAFKNPFNWVGSRIAQVDEIYSSFVAERILEVLSNAPDFRPKLIASHGQTLFHQPQAGFTFQLGNGSVIAAKTGIPCVSDFRSADIALGGQGAPLVPTGDELLFGAFDNCVNIGGFANCSFQENNLRKAFDMVPANFVLNSLAQKLSLPYDDGGKLAASGKLIDNLLGDLNALKFYQIQPPKSLGAEFVEQEIFPLLEKYKKHNTVDLIQTYTEHIAIQIAQNLKPGNCLISGGGTKNNFLINRIEHHAQDTELVIPFIELIDFKEALIFALLGVLRWKKMDNIFASVTGASKDHCAGTIHL